MINSKYINWIIATVLLLSICFTLSFMFYPGQLNIVTSTSQPDYVTKIFNKDDIVSIDIKVDKTEWEDMLKNASNEEYISCDVIVNGTTFKSVGIRPKGNSSLSMVKSNGDSNRYSFKFEFDHYVKNQTCFGLDKFVVNNIISDSTYMKEYLSYDIMNYIGVTTPLYSYTKITVNGEDWGLYLAVESFEESFAKRAFGSDYGNLYSVKSMGGGAKVQEFSNQQQDRTFDINAQNNNTMRPDNMGNKMPGFGKGLSGGGSLVYTDDNISNYSSIFDNATLKTTKKSDNKRVITALKNLSEGTDLEKYFDVDSILRYFAAHTVVVNLDSYVSNMQQNYALYEKDGKVSILPWDYNLAFGGFQSGDATAAVNFPIDTPVSGVELSERPLFAKLLEVDEYKEKYHKYLQEIVDGYFNNGTYENTIEKVDTLIGEYVKDDPTAFYSYDKYKESLPELKEFGLLRAKSIQGQLEGTIPSTTAGQTAEPNKLIDASSVSLELLGAQGGGGRGQGGMGQPQGMGPMGENQPGNMPNMEVMAQVMQIIQSANGNELTDEQITKLNELGVTENQIQMFKNMPQMGNGVQQGRNNRPEGIPFGNGKEINSNNTVQNGNSIIIVATSFVCIILGIIFVFFYRRKRI